MSIILNETLSTRENNFDLIRFTAAMAVIFSHSFDLTSDYNREPLRVFSNGDSSIGEIAVAIFFATSGFLIMQSYNRTRSINSYFFARFLRIYPGLIFVTLCTVFIIGPLITSVKLSEYFLDIKTIKYLFNATSIKISFHLPGVFDHNPFPMDAVNGSLWSLPYELLCYILVAIAGSVMKRKYLTAFILIPAALIFLPFMSAETFFVYTFYFLCGSLLYIYRNIVRLNFWLCTGLLFIVPLNLGYNPSFILKTMINGISLSYIVIYIATIKIQSLRNFSRYGDFSYGLYIWAFPVQQIIAYQYSHWNNYSNFVISSLITLVLAFFSWHIIEKRALRLKSYSINQLKHSAFQKKYVSKQKELADAE